MKRLNNYQNNPFYIGLQGIQLLFKSAQSVGIYAAILAGVGLLMNMVSGVSDMANLTDDTETTSGSGVQNDQQVFSTVDPEIVIAVAVVVLLFVIGIMLVSLLVYGVLEYTSGRIARGEKVTLTNAFEAVLKNFHRYIWLYIVLITKIFLWTLLLVVPGIIMSVRYSLAGTVFFAEGKRGNAAIKRSAELTKGAWFTTFAGTGLWNMMTLGSITPLVTPSANAILYRQLQQATDENIAKPNAHWLSWLTFFIPFLIILPLLLFIGLIALIVWLG